MTDTMARHTELPREEAPPVSAFAVEEALPVNVDGEFTLEIGGSSFGDGLWVYLYQGDVVVSRKYVLADYFLAHKARRAGKRLIKDARAGIFWS